MAKHSMTYYENALISLKALIDNNYNLIRESTLAYTATELSNAVNRYKAKHPNETYHTLLRVGHTGHLDDFENKKIENIGTETTYIDSPHGVISGRKSYFFNADNLEEVFADRVYRIDTIMQARVRAGEKESTDYEGVVVMLLPDSVLRDERYASQISFSKPGTYNKSISSMANDELRETAIAPEIVDKCECIIVQLDIADELRENSSDVYKDHSPLLYKYVVDLMDGNSALKSMVETNMKDNDMIPEEDIEREKAQKDDRLPRLENFVRKSARINESAHKDWDNINDINDYYEDEQSRRELLQNSDMMPYLVKSNICLVYAHLSGKISDDILNEHLQKVGSSMNIEETTNYIMGFVDQNTYPLNNQNLYSSDDVMW